MVYRSCSKTCGLVFVRFELLVVDVEHERALGVFEGPCAMPQGPVLLEVEAHDVRDDPVAFVALQVELQSAAFEHGQVAHVNAAPVRQREAAQRVGFGVVVEVCFE